jgi:hypothetical protein
MIAKSNDPWKTFVIEKPRLLNQIFKNCIHSNKTKLKDYFKIIYENNPRFKPDNNFTDIKLSQDFGRLYSEQLFTDLEIEVEGKILKVHKNILMGMIWIHS